MPFLTSYVARMWTSPAHIYYDERFDDNPKLLNIDCAYPGTVRRERAAAFGFMPPILYTTGSTIEGCKFRP